MVSEKENKRFEEFIDFVVKNADTPTLLHYKKLLDDEAIKRFLAETTGGVSSG